MKSAFTFLQKRALLAKYINAKQPPNHQTNSAELPPTIRDAAKRGWSIFPVLTSSLQAIDADALIGIATSEISILEHIPLLYPNCQFGLLTGPASGVWVAEMDGPRSAAALYELAGVAQQVADELWDGLTLLSRGGTRTYAYFKWPAGLSMRPVRHLDPGLILHGECSWIPLPPSEFSGVRHAYDNDVAVATTPDFLVDRLFKPLYSKSGAAVPLKFPQRTTYSGSLPCLRRPDSFGKERRLLHFPVLLARRTKFRFPRRR